MKELKHEELENITGGVDLGQRYIDGHGDIYMYTSSMKKITGSSSATYYRKDSVEAFRVISVSNNFETGEVIAFSTTYFFKADDSNICFSFTATEENNICYDLR